MSRFSHDIHIVLSIYQYQYFSKTLDVDDLSLLKPVKKLVLVCSATSIPSETAFSSVGYTVMNRGTKLLSKNLSPALFLENYYSFDIDTN